jgi:hypothetical protein
MAAAAQRTREAKEAAQEKVLAEITKTVPLCDEARQRIAQLWPK